MQMPKPSMEQKLETKTGVVVGCNRLNVRSAPTTESNSVAIIQEGTEVTIDILKAGNKTETSDFYKVCLASGVEGFCMRKYVQIV